jgi:hypothetical protein
VEYGVSVVGILEVEEVLTVRLATLVILPPVPVAVRIYVVVIVGLTVLVPLIATEPIPWLIETVVALLVTHVNVAKAPEEIEIGAIVKVAVGAGLTVTWTVLKVLSVEVAIFPALSFDFTR